MQKPKTDEQMKKLLSYFYIMLDLSFKMFSADHDRLTDWTLNYLTWNAGHFKFGFCFKDPFNDMKRSVTWR